ncbi:MAG: hypothetical protein MUC87_16985 [Bacteroidia bacterium]|jgi:hypothetical protein|nr:hypothetical protein [Bacteroidia bacterium]
MKIAYVFSYNPSLPGVLSKINDKLLLIRAAGAEVEAVAICLQPVPENDQAAGVRFAVFRYTPVKWLQTGPLKILSSLHRSRAAAKMLERELEAVKPDVVLMRYGTANPFTKSLMSRYRVVFEHNTKEVEQLAMSYHGVRRSGWEKATVYWLEKYFAPRILKRAAGIVGVTQEITHYELQRAGRKIPSITIANGIHTQRCPVSQAGAYNGGTLHILFLAGVAAPWHGVDRLLKSIKPHHDVKVWLAGNFLPADLELARSLGHKAELTGMLKGDALDKVFDKVHLAIASLAPQRVGITEMSALKVREYAARAVPFVTAFDDPDLDENLNQNFWFRVPMGEDEIPLDEIIAFAQKATQDDTRSALRKFAEANLDYAAKMRKLTEFLNTLTRP